MTKAINATSVSVVSVVILFNMVTVCTKMTINLFYHSYRGYQGGLLWLPERSGFVLLCGRFLSFGFHGC
jgi:hypothetical protein